MLILLLASIVAVLCAIKFYKWATQYHDYFEKREIKYVRPKFLLGTTGDIMFQKYAPNVFYKELYDRFPNEKFFCIFDFRKPLFVLRDADLIKQIGVKDFDYFVYHQKFTEENSEDLLGNSLFFLRGDRWRDMRAILSPAFTGSKMRQMFVLVTQCVNNMCKFFKKEAESGQSFNYEMKSLFSKYANDIIATAAFGIEVDPFKDPNNEFLLFGEEIMTFNMVRVLKFILMRMAPWLKPLI